MRWAGLVLACGVLAGCESGGPDSARLRAGQEVRIDTGAEPQASLLVEAASLSDGYRLISHGDLATVVADRFPSAPLPTIDKQNRASDTLRESRYVEVTMKSGAAKGARGIVSRYLLRAQ